MFGMTWARAAIFYCSDYGKELLLQRGASMALATSLPAVAISTVVQVINQPIVRGTITIQDPKSCHPNLSTALAHIYRTRGVQGLWHGTSASVLKTVPKYVTAIWIKDVAQSLLPPPTAPVGTVEHRSQVIRRSAAKSIAAGVAGAALTNPLDVIRNEMFKTEEGPLQTTSRLLKQEGFSFALRGMARNILAVAVPIGMTIFLTDTIMFLRAARKVGDVHAPAHELAAASPASDGFKLQQHAAVKNIICAPGDPVTVCVTSFAVLTAKYTPRIWCHCVFVMLWLLARAILPRDRRAAAHVLAVMQAMQLVREMFL
eukprot:CAMPEP_0119366840 /NCGR_PEP_ID=MMETSP1334-20130426/13659_1 /TAXON_ID=127549 /ORGANISM="Calcidiscus leptoporus, Strain RCC1130" /LENGTH=314 /DNA_ID=CAMNT_0007383127 /DNA_START=345 /DNA_END=1288 /DNA_ORIENTATION=-